MDKHLRAIEADDIRRAEIREQTRKLVEGIEGN